MAKQFTSSILLFIIFILIGYSEMKQCFEELSENSECRVILLTGAGKHFTAGLDLKEAMVWGQELAAIEDSARKGHYLEKKIKLYQV